MEGTPEEIQDRMRRFGFSEKEALAWYHLKRAWDLFEEINPPVTESGGFIAGLYNEMYFGVHFVALQNERGRSVLRRQYPEGWGPLITPEEEG